MQRLLRIVLFITFMLLIILWFSTIFNTCNKKDKAAIDTAQEMQDTSGVYQDLDDDLFEDDNLFTEEGNGSDTEMTQDNDQPENSPELFEDNTTDYTDYTGTPEESTPTSQPTSQTNYDATYLVVAGSFLVKENATRMQNKLINMGYSAEVRNFDYSQYHSVIAGRYNDQSSADRVVKNLTNQGIKCYVHKRKP